ncbi:MAG: hypothetical protein ACK4WM_03965 [Thermoflexales bacterium]
MANTSNVQELVCANIGPRERRKRLWFGVVGALFSALTLAWLLTTDAPWWAALVLLPLSLAMSTGFLQWREQVCIANVRMNVRNMDSGYEPVTDETLRRALQQKAQRIQAQAILVALLVTAVSAVLALVW